MDERARRDIAEIRRYARQATAWARKGGASWTNDEKTVAAIAHMVAQIGEVARRLPTRVKAGYPTVPWAQITGMRNRIYHDYGALDVGVLKETVRRDLPELVRALRDARE